MHTVAALASFGRMNASQFLSEVKSEKTCGSEVQSVEDLRKVGEFGGQLTTMLSMSLAVISSILRQTSSTASSLG